MDIGTNSRSDRMLNNVWCPEIDGALLYLKAQIDSK